MQTQHTHRGAKATVDLEDGKLVKVGVVPGVGELSVGHDLVIGGRLDAIPVAMLGSVDDEDVGRVVHTDPDSLRVPRGSA